MDMDTLEALEKRLKQSITITEGPRVGRLLPQVFKSDNCDDTLDKTREWLKDNGRDVEKDIRWLKRQGGVCDCKVITHVIWPLRSGAEY